MTTCLDDLAHPIVLASMAGATNGRLAAAVSRAGGLGTLGFGSTASVADIEREAAVASGEGVAYGIGLMLWHVAQEPGMLEAAVATDAVLLSLSFGDPAPAVARVRALGRAVTIASQVGTGDEARRALDAGVDVLVARGSEGGGHGRGEVATLPLLQEVLSLAGEVPVLGAGGVATGRGVAAVLAAGAAGAWVGTPFAACVESPMAEPLKAAIRAAGTDDTVYTRAFDIAQRFAWPEQFGGRALRNDFTDEWAERTHDLQAAVEASSDLTEKVRRSRSDGDLRIAPAYAGQAAGLVPGLPRTAAEVMAELTTYPTHLQAAQRWLRT